MRLVRRVAPARPLRSLWDRVPLPPVEAFVGCDVFHGTNYLAPRAWRTPVVVTVHDLWFREHPEHVTAQQAALTRLLPNILRRASAVITVSDFVKRELAEWQPQIAERVTSIPIAPHARSGAALRPPRMSEAPFALMLGTVNQRKNVGLALDALVRWRAAGLELPLVLAGGVAADVDLNEQLCRRRLDTDIVVALGFVTDPEVSWLLDHARLLVSSSLHEGFGIPLIEAMGRGLPVVAVEGGAVDEVTAGAARLVEADPDALADAVLSVATDEAQRRQMTVAGMGIAGRYNWHRTAEQTLAVYRSVVRNSLC